MIGAFAAWAFVPGAFATAWTQRQAAPVLPAAWQAATLGAAGFIGPVSAAVALARGDAAVFSADGLRVGGALLIGPAGKVYAFQSAATAARWVELNQCRPGREWALIAGLDAQRAAVAKERKAATLAAIARQVVGAAGRCGDPARAAALIAESNFCLNKWGKA